MVKKEKKKKSSKGDGEDKELKEKLINKGLKQAKKFNWQKVADETYQIYQKVVEKK